MNHLFAWYKLLHVKGLGDKSARILLQRLKEKGMSVEEVFDLSEKAFAELVPEFGKGRLSRIRYAHFHELDEERIEESWEQLQQCGIRLVPATAEAYPSALASRLKDEAPLVLFCKGNLNLLGADSVAIVGSRHADEVTLQLTKDIAAALAGEGLNVVSGYAKGVDTWAHTGALAADGTTTAVLSEGLFHLSEKKEFADIPAWERNTLFVSQFLPVTRWAARNAMMRNKVVVGLSKGVVVMASGPERDAKGRMSGTFQAARAAMEKEVPVFVLDPASMAQPPAGNAELIARGARAFSSPQALIELFHQSKPKPAAKPTQLSFFD